MIPVLFLRCSNELYFSPPYFISTQGTIRGPTLPIMCNEVLGAVWNLQRFPMVICTILRKKKLEQAGAVELRKAQSV